MPSPAFEKLEPIRSHVTRTATWCMMFIDPNKARQVTAAIRNAREQIKADGRIGMMDLITLTRDEALVLGFRPSTENPGLFLMPDWMWFVVPSIGRLEGNDGRTHSYDFGARRLGAEPLSNDVRNGLLYYGVRFHPDGTMNCGA